jgi:hypothetical protein
VNFFSFIYQGKILPQFNFRQRLTYFILFGVLVLLNSLTSSEFSMSAPGGLMNYSMHLQGLGVDEEVERGSRSLCRGT